jgi:hypothetical protein
LSSTLFAQISPGDLTKAHAHLEGNENCTKCHKLGEEVTNEKCLDCHSEIALLIKANRGYHSSAEVRSKKCYNCHGEHFGRNFESIRFSEKGFNHSLTGYKLAGKHREAACRDCHRSENISDGRINKRRGTWLGLDGSRCVNCHADVHSGQLGTNCAGCHTIEGFTPVKDFDHNQAEFKLTGAHRNVDCSSCHPEEMHGGKTTMKFKGIPFGSCSSCHNDPHSGKFGGSCASCHMTSSFHMVKGMDTFDHSITGFELLGAHSSLDCSKCHTGSYSKPVSHKQCMDCHEDYHKGDFTEGITTKDCSECHTVDGFTPSLFGIDAHNQSDFPLKGSHLAVSCISCHYKDQRWEFTISHNRCTDCHENIHKDKISSEYMADGNCGSCHTVESWRKVEFDHSKTGYQLTGVHSRKECRTCHFIERKGGKAEQQFASLSTACENCHNDEHHSQFADNAGATDCGNCHTTKNWNPEKFSHAQTSFPLTGAHAKTDCNKCHKEVTEEKVTFIKYKFEETSCALCHS